MQDDDDGADPPVADIDDFPAVQLNDTEVYLDGEERNDFPEHYTYELAGLGPNNVEIRQVPRSVYLEMRADSLRMNHRDGFRYEEYRDDGAWRIRLESGRNDTDPRNPENGDTTTVDEFFHYRNRHEQMATQYGVFHHGARAFNQFFNALDWPPEGGGGGSQTQ
jgi:hypothetical protein